MQAEAPMRLMRLVRRSYEMGRLRVAAMRGALALAFVGATGVMLLGRAAAPWALLSGVVVLFAEWRGSFFARGARRGLLAGWLSLMLPLSLLRPCCANGRMTMVDGQCCTMPSVCGAAGVALGLLLVLALPRAPRGRGWEVALGAAMGALSVGAVRCSGLFAGEMVGLLGGLAAGMAASMAFRAWTGVRDQEVK
jgi:hypothetical protein